MNPIKKIGRYEIPILSVIAIRKRNREGWRRYAFWLRSFWNDGYDVTLTSGCKLHFTHEEKAAFDREIEHFNLVLQVYGAARGMGLRG